MNKAMVDLFLWTLSAGFGILGLWVVLAGSKARSRPRCPKCSYDMRGLKSLRCPECGFTADRERDLRKGLNRCHLTAATLLVVCGGLIAFAPKVRQDGFVSVLPVTCLIFIHRYRDDLWAYTEIQRRVGTVNEDGAFVYQRGELADWQWEALCRTCASKLGSTPYGYAHDAARRCIRSMAEMGIDPPDQIGDSIASAARGHSRRAVWKLLYNDDFVKWLGDAYDPVHESLLQELAATTNEWDAWLIPEHIARGRPSSRGLKELLRIVGVMANEAVATMALDATINQMFYEYPEGSRIGDELSVELASLLSSDHATIRYDVQLLLALKTNSSAALSALAQASVATASESEIQARTKNLVLAMEDARLLDQQLADLEYLEIIFPIDAELARFIIKQLVEDGSQSAIDMARRSRGDMAFQVAILGELAINADPSVRELVPALLMELDVPYAEAMAMVERLGRDGSHEVRAAAEGARRILRGRDKDQKEEQ